MEDSGVPIAKMRVLKRYAPAQDGAKRLAWRYGDSLVCVRHRLDPSGAFRITTVELVVDRWPIRPSPKAWVRLKLGPCEKILRATLISQGGVWSSKERLWSAPRSVAKRLGLLPFVVPKPP